MATLKDSMLYLTRSGGLDDSYSDTYYFKSSEEKFKFFTDLTPARFDSRSFQRYSKNSLTVQISIEDAEKYDYLVFRNRNTYYNEMGKYYAEWYYAFIDGFEYVSDNVTRINYTIDVIQTYFMKGTDDSLVTMLPCYIERQHAEKDELYSHLEPENLDVGDYVTWTQSAYGCNDTEYSILIGYQETLPIEVPDDLGVTEGIYGKTYHGVKYIHIPCTENNIELADDLINALKVANFGNVISISMYPTSWITPYTEENYHPGVSHKLFTVVPPLTLDGYQPKNNKMFNYPFCCWNISGGGSSGKDFAFEYSGKTEDGKAIARIDCPLGVSTNFVAYPAKYVNRENAVEYSVQSLPFPTCPFVSDKFTSWFANNSLSMIGNCISSLATLGLGGGVSETDVKNYMSSHPVLDEGIANNPTIPQRIREVSEINRVGTEGMLEAYKNSVGTSPNYTGTANLINATLHGIQHANSSQSAQTQSLFSSPRGSGIVMSVKTVRANVAKIIDDYFTMYGYAVNSIGTPNLHTREVFTYIKTRGFKFLGTMPTEARKLITKIHDNGIRYWVPQRYTALGDFTVPNPVLTVDNEGEWV